MDFHKIKNIYMIGIKGVGMTMLAQFLVAKGFKVIGSDNAESFMTDAVLKKVKIKVLSPFSIKNIPESVDLVIYSSAYTPQNNIELALLKKQSKIPVIVYAKGLGEFFNHYFGVAVCGSHGKTTVTAWLGYVLDRSGLSPSVLVGARVNQFSGSALIGRSKLFVAETDEYQNKFQYFQPQAVVLNNIDYDHPDFFKTKNDYFRVFTQFIAKIPRRGWLTANFDDLQIKKIIKQTRARVLSYAINSPADFRAVNICSKNGRQSFDVLRQNKKIDSFSILLPGDHNISNALAVIVSALQLGVPMVKIKKHLAGFKGADRRLEILGKYRGALIIDDYAHHPTEIKAALSGVKSFYQNKKLIVVFHPHTYTRTKVLLADFAQSFALADEVIILGIYGSAREKQGGVSSVDLVKKIKEFNKQKKIKQSVRHFKNLQLAESYLAKHLSKNELLLLMGAGDVFRIGQGLLKKA